MSDKEKAIVMAYTGVCMLTGNKFQIFHKYIEDIMGRPIMTHEMAYLTNAIKEKSKDDFIKLCKADILGEIRSEFDEYEDTDLIKAKYVRQIIDKYRK